MQRFLTELKINNNSNKKMKILFLSTLVFGSEIRRARTVEAEVAEQREELVGSAVPYQESPDIIRNSTNDTDPIGEHEGSANGNEIEVHTHTDSPNADSPNADIAVSEVCLKLRSDRSVWFWSGDDVTAHHHAATGQVKSTKVVLKYRSTEQNTCFENFKPEDRIEIVNGGDNGVFINQIFYNGDEIDVNGKTSFWIDGDNISCNENISISRISIQNGKAVWHSCSKVSNIQ